MKALTKQIVISAVILLTSIGYSSLSTARAPFGIEPCVRTCTTGPGGNMVCTSNC